MAEINISSAKSSKRPSYMIKDDIKRSKISVTKEEWKSIPITNLWAQRLGREEGNVKQLFANIFKNTVMVQILDPFTNRMICVGDNGNQINTNGIGRDFECASCKHYIQACDEFPSGQCSWSFNRFKEKFGNEKPKGLKELIKVFNNQEDFDLGDPLTQEEVLQLAGGLDEEGFVDETD